jgi:hypothetical protein
VAIFFVFAMATMPGEEAGRKKESYDPGRDKKGQTHRFVSRSLAQIPQNE